MNRSAPADRFDPRRLERVLRSDFGLGDHEDVFVAFSGGLDSTVLLHALLHVESIDNERISALHANHGLNDDARRWEQWCRQRCREWGVRFRSHRVEPEEIRGRGMEAMAREVRYRWLSGALTDGSVLMTAHHLDDQVETVLAGLFRGSGVRGLAGISAARPFARGWLWRPLLEVPRALIAKYGAVNGLEWIEDPMNTDCRFTRNHLRHEVLPVVREKWPGVDTVIARSARNFLDASELLDEIAESDLLGVPQRSEGGFHTLSIPDLRRYRRPRMINALRRWFVQCGFEAPSRRRLLDVVTSLIERKPEPTCMLSWPGTELRRYRDRLYLSGTTNKPAIWDFEWDRTGTEPVMLNDRVLTARITSGDGIRRSTYESSAISIRPRSGGERCRAPGSACTKTLKKIFQEKGVPPWRRNDFPLLYVGGELAGIAGLCYCQPFAAEGNEPGVVFDVVEVQGAMSEEEDLFP